MLIPWIFKLIYKIILQEVIVIFGLLFPDAIFNIIYKLICLIVQINRKIKSANRILDLPPSSHRFKLRLYHNNPINIQFYL